MTRRSRSLLLGLALLVLLLASAFSFGAFEPEARAQGPEDDRFVPSEELSADSAISFPVDI